MIAFAKPPGSSQARSADELLAEFRQTGAPAPFEEVVRRYAAMVFSECFAVTKSRHDAEDAAQATFLTLAVQARTGDEIRHLGPWLQRVARRVALDQEKSKRRRKRREDNHHRINGTTGVATPEAPSLDQLELRHEISEEIQQLPARYRMPLILHYYGGLSRDQMAKELKCKPATLGVRLFRAREMLGKRLTKRGVAIPAAMIPIGVAAVVRDSVAAHGMLSMAAGASQMAHAASALALQLPVHGMTSAHIAMATGQIAGGLCPTTMALVDSAAREVILRKVKAIVAAAAIGASALAAGSAQVVRKIQNGTLTLPSVMEISNYFRLFNLPTQPHLRAEEDAPSTSPIRQIAAVPAWHTATQPLPTPSPIQGLPNFAQNFAINSAQPFLPPITLTLGQPHDGSAAPQLATASPVHDPEASHAALPSDKKRPATDDPDAGVLTLSAGVSPDAEAALVIPPSAAGGGGGLILPLGSGPTGLTGTFTLHPLASNGAARGGFAPSLSGTLASRSPVGPVQSNLSSEGSVLRGWGKVPFNGNFDMDGLVIADGYRQSHTLDLSAIGRLARSSQNGPTDINGWYAVNGGKLTLPALPVIAGASATVLWGDVDDGTSLDLVNSLRLTLHDVTTSGALTIALLAADRSDLPPVPNTYDILSAWSLASTASFGKLDVEARYALPGSALAAAQDGLGLFFFDGKHWKSADSTLDPSTRTLSAAALPPSAFLALFTSKGATHGLTVLDAEAAAETADLGSLDASPAGVEYSALSLADVLTSPEQCVQYARSLATASNADDLIPATDGNGTSAPVTNLTPSVTPFTPGTVPEPAGAVLLPASLTLLARRRRRV